MNCPNCESERVLNPTKTGIVAFGLAILFSLVGGFALLVFAPLGIFLGLFAFLFAFAGVFSFLPYFRRYVGYRCLVCKHQWRL